MLSDNELEQKVKPTLWWRYVNHIYVLWERNREVLKNFLDKINTAEQSINFTQVEENNELAILQNK